MVCPKCAHDHTRVAQTDKRGALTVRLRYCPKCRFSFSSTERPSFTLFTQEEIEEYERYVAEELAQSQNQSK
jgi:transcriptional regulator NrdR family protein